MTPEEMRASSQKKFNQVTELMALLHVSFVPKQKLTKEGFLEHVVVFIDDEQYPSPENLKKEIFGEGVPETPVTENQDAGEAS